MRGDRVKTRAATSVILSSESRTDGWARPAWRAVGGRSRSYGRSLLPGMLDHACYCALPGTMEHWQVVIRVAFIGAGSVEFARNVVTDLCSYPELTCGPCWADTARE